MPATATTDNKVTILSSLSDRIDYLDIHAKVSEFTLEDERALPLIVAAMQRAARGDSEVASVDPVGENHLPRMLQLSGWLTFADEVNLNDKAFTKADLDEAVASGMFRAPFFGMIDYNHDFSLYGVWYDAQMRFDDASGKWGIWGEGVIFAWRYTELANNMLAMQQRQGHIDLSMACLSEFYEPAKTADGKSYLLMRKPVFFTTSVLDVDPAFPNARALGSEDPKSTPEKRAAELLAADRASHIEEASMAKKNTDTVDVNDNEEKIESTEAEQDEATVEDTSSEEVVVEESAVEEEATEATEEASTKAEDGVVEEDNEEVVLDESNESVDAQLQAALLALRTLKADNESLSAQVASLMEKENAREAERLAAERAERDEARRAEIPESVASEMAKDENAALLNEWLAMDDASWEATKKVLALASSGKKSLVERSAEEGTLSNTTERESGKWAISRHMSEIRTKRNRK